MPPRLSWTVVAAVGLALASLQPRASAASPPPSGQGAAWQGAAWQGVAPAGPSAMPRVAPPSVPLPRVQAPYVAAQGRSSTGPSPSATAAVPSVAGLAGKEIGRFDTPTMEGFVNDLNRQLGGGGPPLTWRGLLDMAMQGRLPWRPADLVRGLVGVFTREVRGNLALLGQLLILIVLAAVLRQLSAAFEGETVRRVADAVVFLALGALALAGFDLAGRTADAALGTLTSFMLALIPALTGLLAASGAWVSAGLLHPLVIGALNGVGLAVRSWVFPLVFLAAVLDIVSSFAPTFRLTSLAALMRQVGLGLLGVLLAGFIGVVAVQGAAGAVADGVALRTAKFAAKAFVPVVGSMFADAAELVITSGFLVRSSLGLAGLALVALMVMVPLCKLLALWGAYRLSAALAEPVGGPEIGRVLGGIAATLSLVTVAVAVVGLMFFLALAVLLGASGAVLMMR